VVEVSDSTLATDLGRKAQLYARHGIPEYWVVDCAGARITQLWAPTLDGYRERRELLFGERLRAATVATLDIDTDLLD
jgi:Uma2 family endonuclease